jgi:hypothetical protein
MMVLFSHAARLAMVVFDPYLSSRPLAKALMESPPGALITQVRANWRIIFRFQDGDAFDVELIDYH